MKLLNFLHNPKLLILRLAEKGKIKMPDDEFLKLKFQINMNQQLDLNNPTSFNEKLQWLKINDRKEVYTNMVDKYYAKEYISNVIGEKYVIPTIGVFDKFDDIDFESLPNQFVIKLTHDSGGIVICKDKKEFDYKKAKKIINKYLKRKYFYLHREWPYKNVNPKIIVEKFLDCGEENLQDYKIHCFNGKAKLILVCKDRFSKNGMTEDFFDNSWHHLDIKRPNHMNSLTEIKKPICLSEMIELAEKISKDIPFLRVDFYEIDSKVYFGEITFYPSAGFGKFIPNEWDYKLGSWIELPNNKTMEC